MKYKDEHVIEALGRSRIVIINGSVVEVGPPLIKNCPLAKKFAKPVYDFYPKSIRRNIESRIHTFGMCTKERVIIADEDFVPFGASELISCGIRHGLLDCAVLVCDGAGTVIATTPRSVQGIGGRMSGLIRTSPIVDVIKRIEADGGKVLDPSEALINQVKGTALACKSGFERIAVTVTKPEDADEIRSCYANTLIFGVHLTGISKEESERLIKVCDLVTGCASRWVRKIAGETALLQAGSSIPVFALTKIGKNLIIEKVKEMQRSLLVKIEKLPYSGENYPDPLI